MRTPNDPIERVPDNKPTTPRAFRETDLDWVLALNRTVETELSPLTAPELMELVHAAFHATVAGQRYGFLIAFDQDASHASPNFLWFRQRHSRFVYVDRIAVSEDARGMGIARALYQDLFRKARAAGHDSIFCEINVDPPNPVSDTFHEQLGFTEVGQNRLTNGKSVRYMRKNIVESK